MDSRRDLERSGCKSTLRKSSRLSSMISLYWLSKSLLLMDEAGDARGILRDWWEPLRDWREPLREGLVCLIDGEGYSLDNLSTSITVLIGNSFCLIPLMSLM